MRIDVGTWIRPGSAARIPDTNGPGPRSTACIVSFPENIDFSGAPTGNVPPSSASENRPPVRVASANTGAM